MSSYSASAASSFSSSLPTCARVEQMNLVELVKFIRENHYLKAPGAVLGHKRCNLGKKAFIKRMHSLNQPMEEAIKYINIVTNILTEDDNLEEIIKVEALYEYENN